MTKSNLPKSVRKYIRMEKAKIRKTLAGPDKEREALEALYKRLNVRYSK